MEDSQVANTLLNQTTSLSTQSLLDAIAFLERCFDLTIVANEDDDEDEDETGGDGADEDEDRDEDEDQKPRG